MKAAKIAMYGSAALALLSMGCSKQSTVQVDPASGPTRVYTVNYPLRYFAERIGGDSVHAVFPEADGDPAYWKPDAETVAGYQKADMILLNGADYAKWVRMVSLPERKVVNTGKALADRFIELDRQATHTHGPEGEHAHAGVAFTTWLDPTLAVEQARAIKDALSVARPDNKAVFAERFAQLEQELQELDGQFRSIVSTDPGRPLVFSHPVYQYFERRYGLNGKSVHWEPDAAPTDEMWTEFTQLLKEHPAKWMVWEAEPLPETVAALSELGVESMTVDPCGNVPDSGDFLDVMRQSISQLRSAYDDR